MKTYSFDNAKELLEILKLKNYTALDDVLKRILPLDSKDFYRISSLSPKSKEYLAIICIHSLLEKNICPHLFIEMSFTAFISNKLFDLNKYDFSNAFINILKGKSSHPLKAYADELRKSNKGTEVKFIYDCIDRLIPALKKEEKIISNDEDIVKSALNFLENKIDKKVKEKFDLLIQNIVKVESFLSTKDINKIINLDENISNIMKQINTLAKQQKLSENNIFKIKIINNQHIIDPLDLYYNKLNVLNQKIGRYKITKVFTNSPKTPSISHVPVSLKINKSKEPLHNSFDNY